MATIADINAEARALVDADTTSYPAATLLRRINQAYEEIVGMLIARDKNWRFDDSNYTDTPVGDGDLVDAQQIYSYDSTYLSVDRVEVKDISGIYHKLKKIREVDIEESLEEYEKTDGLPKYYVAKYNSIYLYPAPSSASATTGASTNGIVVYYKRTADIFTTAQVTAGTKVPGFPSPYHYLLSYKAALPYALSYKKDRVPLLRAEIERMTKELMDLASVRDADKVPRLVPNIESCR